jgi:hypothetical protein
MRSAWKRGEPSLFRVAVCVGALAAAQYRVTCWSVMRNDRRPVGWTRNTTSGPALPSLLKVGWMHVKRSQTRTRPRRDPRPSPPQVTVARSTRTRFRSTCMVSLAIRSSTLAWGQAGVAPNGRRCDASPVAWPDVASSRCVSEGRPAHAPPARATARSGSAMAAGARERTRIAYGFPDRPRAHARSRVGVGARRAGITTSSAGTER